MTGVARTLLVVTAMVAIARAAAALLHAGLDFSKPLSIYFTEPHSVHLARRVQLGESLYPEWRNFPHVVNVFTPAYFWGVGLLGRATDANLVGLQRLGRATTIGFWLLGAVLSAWAVRRHGRTASVVAAGIALSAGVTMGFGWMVRPDLAADALGFAGFLAATSSAPLWVAVACAAAAVLCKQTAVVYLVAAALALVWQGRLRRAAVSLIATVAGTLIVLGLYWANSEPRVFADIFLEVSTPWRMDHWRKVLARVVLRAGDVPVLFLAGVAIWLRDVWSNDGDARANARRWLAMAGLVLLAGFLGSAKHGSDVNYFLPLRYVAAAAAAEIVARLHRRPSIPTLSVALVAVVAVGYWSAPWAGALSGHTAFDGARRRMLSGALREIEFLERQSRTGTVLTNNDDLALRIDNPFVDSFLFKSLVETARLQPTELVERVRRGEYDVVATTADVDDPKYLASAFGVPAELAAAIQERYEKSGRGAVTYYRPKPGSPRVRTQRLPNGVPQKRAP